MIGHVETTIGILPWATLGDHVAWVDPEFDCVCTARLKTDGKLHWIEYTLGLEGPRRRSRRLAVTVGIRHVVAVVRDLISNHQHQIRVATLQETAEVIRNNADHLIRVVS